MRRAAASLLVLLAIAGLGAAPAAAAPPHAAAGAASQWALAYSSGFGSPLNHRNWTLYNGTPHCCRSTIWAPSHVTVGGGVLRLRTYRDPAHGKHWTSAGLSMGKSLNLTYGRWIVRFRMTRGRGVGMCMMLWPKSGWPPEIDFAEEPSDLGASRSIMSSTLHYTSHNLEIRHKVQASFWKWHTMSVRWEPGAITYSIDGHAWASVTGSMVPSVPMHLGIQTGVGSNGFTGVMPDSSTPAHVDLQIDWIKIYRRR
jgi:beta-glucanase (GH16 family)